MATILHPDCLELPELQPYRVRKNNYELLTNGLFLAEGKRVVERLLCSSVRTRSILTTETVWNWLQRQVPSERLTGIPVYIANREFLASLVGYDVQQPILALGEVPPDTHPEKILQQQLARYLFVATDQLMNPDNLGVIVRNCVAFHANLLLTGPSSASPYYRRAVRNSMGTIFELPTYHASSLVETLRSLRDKWQFQIVAADPEGAHDLQNFNFQNSLCLVFGNEAIGISTEVRELCTHTVRIPLNPAVDSFNVANAAAIFLWEVWKQRHASQE